MSERGLRTKARFALHRARSSLPTVAYEARRLWGHRDYRRFVVMTRSRTGSTLLMSMLASHPQIHARGEILRTLEGRDSHQVLDRFFGRHPRGIAAVGFKLFYYHPLDSPSEPIWSYLEQMDGVSVIHLKRWNLLRTLVSREIAGRSGAWRKGDRHGSVDDEKAVTLSARELEGAFEQTREWESECERRFADRCYLELLYEDLVRAPEEEFSRLLGWLDLPQTAPASALEKQNPEPLPALIRNYSKLKSEFAETPWASFFSD